MESTTPVAAARPELGLREVIKILWRHRWLIVVVTLGCTAAATAAAYLSAKQYTAVMVLSPVSESQNGALGGLGGLASQFGGLAALAGISVSGDSKKSESLAVLQSEALTEKYISDNGLLQILFAGAWDAQTGKWRVQRPEDTPTPWMAAGYFKKKIRKVTTDAKSGLVTLEVKWRDPQQAAQWANGLVQLTNVYLRDKAIAESERNIAYLSGEASKTDVVGVRQAIYAILQTEINKAMIARGSEEYALKVLDPAVVPERPSSPQPMIWIAAGFCGGLLLAVAAALLRAIWISAMREA